jgi:hypothetical protein
MADFNHVDYTAELNRIIVALTGIRDDVRLLRRLQEDPESGIVSSAVLNDFQRALLAVSMSTAAGNTAATIADAIEIGAATNGGGVAAASGESGADLDAERASILETLGQDPAEQKVLIRVNGIYYWEAEGTAGPDDGLRGSTVQVTPFALGEQLGFDNEVNGQITAGAPSGPPDQIPNPSKPRKRWAFARPDGATASQLANPNADLVDPATGQVVARTPAEQSAANTSGNTSPPAAVYGPQ